MEDSGDMRPSELPILSVSSEHGRVLVTQGLDHRQPIRALFFHPIFLIAANIRPAR